jgi:hypothetical protein
LNCFPCRIPICYFVLNKRTCFYLPSPLFSGCYFYTTHGTIHIYTDTPLYLQHAKNNNEGWVSQTNSRFRGRWKTGY